MEKQFELLMQEGLEHTIKLSQEQMNQFYQFYQLLIKWNEVMNLTAITEMEQVVIKHFVDSLALVRVFNDLDEKCTSVIDVGTGAG